MALLGALKKALGVWGYKNYYLQVPLLSEAAGEDPVTPKQRPGKQRGHDAGTAGRSRGVVEPNHMRGGISPVSRKSEPVWLMRPDISFVFDGGGGPAGGHGPKREQQRAAEIKELDGLVARDLLGPHNPGLWQT